MMESCGQRGKIDFAMLMMSLFFILVFERYHNLIGFERYLWKYVDSLQRYIIKYQAVQAFLILFHRIRYRMSLLNPLAQIIAVACVACKRIFGRCYTCLHSLPVWALCYGYAYVHVCLRLCMSPRVRGCVPTMWRAVWKLCLTRARVKSCGNERNSFLRNRKFFFAMF